MGTWEAAISLNLEQFDALFEPGPATVPGYLVLLNLKDTDAPALFNYDLQSTRAEANWIG